MKIVMDANVLFSALIRDSITRKIILDYKDKFLFPEYALVEFQKYKNLIINKSGLPKELFDQLFNTILEKVIVVKEKELNSQRKRAIQIIGI